MRFYIKLAVMILLFVAVERSLPAAMRHSAEAAFTLRCGVAAWTGNKELEARLLQEAREQLLQREHQRVLAGGG